MLGGRGGAEGGTRICYCELHRSTVMEVEGSLAFGQRIKDTLTKVKSEVHWRVHRVEGNACTQALEWVELEMEAGKKHGCGQSIWDQGVKLGVVLS